MNVLSAKVSLTDVKVSNEEMSDEDYCVYAVTFEFENTSGSAAVS